ncbi:thymidylate kinase [Moniliophthora roreri MCA 2997]|uniref:Thymidylate kinase n=1 Tax=Moniliophthora roreri (strain MCA 2997) TaxID=1381753 RepID=V2XAV1_MONRO|nr:thymidylate kinase [Moniliophthora roreri MCA 2997]
MPQRAPFIVVEGLDRSGKTTQTATLSSKLKQDGKRVVLIKFPDRTTPIGKMIDSYLKSHSELDDHAIHLLFSANRWELASQIESHLQSGTIVLCDRYAFSGIAFSASKGLSYEWCRAPDVSLPSPDLTLFLDISPEKAQERGGYGEERYEKQEMQRRVREVFSRLGSETLQSGRNWQVIDAGNDRDKVAADIWTHVEPLLNGTDASISHLWTDKIDPK